CRAVATAAPRTRRLSARRSSPSFEDLVQFFGLCFAFHVFVVSCLRGRVSFVFGRKLVEAQDVRFAGIVGGLEGFYYPFLPEVNEITAVAVVGVSYDEVCHL